MTAQNDSTSNLAPVKTTGLKRILILLLPLLILSIAVWFAFWLSESGPKTKKRVKQRNAVLVETEPVKITSERIRISASGTVIAAREVEIKPLISGAIIEVNQNFLPGGQLNKGATLLVIDPSDYRFAFRQQESAVVHATAQLQLESGNQLLAQKEYELLGGQVSDEEMQLMLRQPQLQSLQAALDSAKAKQEAAELNLKRTRITSPFNGIIATRLVNTGSRVTIGTTLATLVDSDKYWIEVTIPVSKLHWIDIPKNGTKTGSNVQISIPSVWGDGVVRTGHVLRLLPGLEEQGRMARLLVEVVDPLSLMAENAMLPPLLIGSWVQVTIDGSELPAVAALDRAWLHDGEHVWLKDASGRLEIRPVKPIFYGRERVLIATGLVEGELLIVSRLPAPIAGMTLRTKDETTAQPDQSESANKKQESR